MTMASSVEQFQFLDEEGRQEIYKWSQKRQKKYEGFRRFIYLMKIFAFDKSLLRSFVHNVNVIVIVQMFLAGIFTYLCSYANLYMDVHVTLFVSPLVFPLAFSINTDFQRREKVLEDLANFKASTMVWFFCLRDWRKPGSFDESFMKAASSKTKGLMFHLREYLLTEKALRRNFILRVMYEDLSDVAQINEKIRTSKLDQPSPISARIIHLHYLMCLSFERLRVIREYRSPRSIRSFTKIFIFALPLLLAPYYVYLGRQANNSWSPYFIGILVAFLFGALQGVQDKLDDPFDGMSEDDINLETLDEWTVQSLEATANRTTRVGRFTVSVQGQGKVEFSAAHPIAGGLKREESFGVNKSHSRKRLGLLPWQRQLSQLYEAEDDSLDTEEINEMHPYKEMLSNLPGNATIVRGGHVKEKRNIEDFMLTASAQSSINPIFDEGFYQTPNSTVQRTVESGQSLGSKVQFNKRVDALASNEGVDSIIAENVTDGYGQLYDAPKTFRSLFLPDKDHVAIQMEPLQRKSSLPHQSGFVAFANSLDASAPRKRSNAKERAESSGMIAHSGVGVASYIQSMNKDKYRKMSAPSLRTTYGADEKSEDSISISSDDSVGILMNPPNNQNMPQHSTQSKFKVQKAKPVSLVSISPTFNDDKMPRETSRANSTEEDKGKASGHTSRSRTPNGSDESSKSNTPVESPMPKTSTEQPRFLVESREMIDGLKKAGSTTKLIDDNIDSADENLPKNTPSRFEITTDKKKKPKKRFGVTKTDSNSELITNVSEGNESEGSDGTLSRVVGRLKEKEIFL